MVKPKLSAGDKYGRLTVQSTHMRSGSPHRYVTCVCECGNTTVVRGSCLTSGETRSCGCLAKELSGSRLRTHGMSKQPLYSVYKDMYRRCYDPRRDDFKHYGERGIKVCGRWLQPAGKGFANFLEDMGERPEGYELDRIDVNGDYTPENCRWATRQEQMQNTRVNHVITFNGETHCLAEWAEILGIKRQILVDRLGKLNWTVEKTLTTLPIRKRKGIRHGQFREGYDGCSNTSGT